MNSFLDSFLYNTYLLASAVISGIRSFEALPSKDLEIKQDIFIHEMTS